MGIGRVIFSWLEIAEGLDPDTITSGNGPRKQKFSNTATQGTADI